LRRALVVAALGMAFAAASCAWPPPLPSPPATNRGPVRTDLPEGQSAQVFRHPGAEGGAINYLLYLPKGYATASQPFPLILYLHGRSLRGDDPELVAKYGLPRRLEHERDFPFVVLSPQLHEDERWVDLEPVVALLDDAIATLPVDRERVYVTGFSMGGGGTWRLANDYPDRFAAAVPLAGTRDDAPIKGLKQVPVWAFHGSADEATSPGDCESMVERIIEAGGDARMTIYPGGNHASVLKVYETNEIYDWLLEHRKHATVEESADDSRH
jgi:predicted peptidase